MSKTYTYSFSSVDIIAKLKDAIGIYPADTSIELTAQGFYDKNDSIRLTPQAEFITGEIAAGGEDYVSITNDEMGTCVMNVGDMTPVHQFIVTVMNGHKQGLNVKGIDLTVSRRAVGDSGRIGYTCKLGSVQNRAAEKGFGATQTGNSYQLRFESMTQAIEGVDE